MTEISSPNNTNPQLQPSPAFPLLRTLMLIIIGVIIGSFATDLLLTKLTPNNTSQLLTKEVNSSITPFGGLIFQKSLIQVRLKGQIVKIEPGAKQKNSQDPGSMLTLRNGSDSTVIFLRDQAIGYTGNFDVSDSWKKTTDSPEKVLNVGDTVVVNVSAPVEKSIPPDSFVGWWYFKI